MITFVLLAHYEKEPCYKVSLGSLMCQTNPNWEAIVIHNGLNPELRDAIGVEFPDDRIKYKERIEPDVTRGVINRLWAINELVGSKYIVQSSVQDYFFPSLVQDILHSFRGDPGFIYWNSINHLWLANDKLDARPEIRKIDWGNFCIKTKVAKQVGIKELMKDEADGIFVEEVMKTGVVTCKIHSILTVHN